MAHRVAGLDLSLAGTAAVVLDGGGCLASALVFSTVARDAKQARDGLTVCRATRVTSGDSAGDYFRTAGVADVVRVFLRDNLQTGAVVGIEEHAFGAQGRSVYQLGHLHGMIRRDVVNLGCRFLLLNVAEVKAAATGRGNAEKAEMVAAAADALELDGLSRGACEALADAYAVARLAFWLDRMKRTSTVLPPAVARLVKARGSTLAERRPIP